MSERVIRWFVPGLLLFYVVFAWGRWLAFAPEIYPFAAWGMFSWVPEQSWVVDVRIHRIGGREFDPPASARDPDNVAGVVLNGHQKLVVNGFVRHLEIGQAERAQPYREFVERHVLGPDTRYEVLRIGREAREKDRHEERTVAFGPFETPAVLAPPDPDTRFEFPSGGRFKKKRKVGFGERREKRRRGP